MDKFIEKNCKHHGETTFVLEGRGTYRCKKCRVESVTKRRRLLKEKLVHSAGGKCSLCGYNKFIGALEFHHKDPNEKDFGLAKANLSYEKAFKEIQKCILVCANCHREMHESC